MMFAVSAMMIYFMRVVPHDIFAYVRIVVRAAAMAVCIVVANVRGSILPSMRNGGYVLIAMFVMIMGVILADTVTTRLAIRRNESEARALGEIRIIRNYTREKDEQEV
ncbi:hypothetical protein BKA65DRAFT_515671 [Rhexocercosporidium sp. MPI-PUGE-AT-0058]|nr:hypothetical protein BKA65DRAFT_515671 [Rhexocercosporidium sp. MPI-PUGE-AT-0058]